MDSQRDTAQNVSSFSLQAQEESSSFRSKTDDIFGSLGSIELKYETDLSKRKADDKKRTHDDGEIDDEGDFKKPNCPSLHLQERRPEVFARERRSDTSSQDGHGRAGGRSNYDSRRGEREHFSRQPRGGRFRTPDHQMNPHKWKEYSLEETCMYGDSYNRNVATDFINDLKRRKNDDQKLSSSSKESFDNCQKLEFHKPTNVKSSEDTDDTSGKSKNYGSVYRMSEYVVGMAKKPKSKHTTNITDEPSEKSSSSKSSLALDHLAEEDTPPTDQLETDTEQVPLSQSSVGKEDSLDSSSEVSDTAKVEEQTGSGQEKNVFKFGKGKGKRNIRARQIDDN